MNSLPAQFTAMEAPSSVLVASTAVDIEAPKKKPKRVLHFSDGTLEEYSDDDELYDGDDSAAASKRASNATAASAATVAEKKSPEHMRWGEYLLHVTMTFGVRSLNFCDYLGEKFAWALGITTPKYGYAIDEREWQKKEEAAERAREERESLARAKRNAVGPDKLGSVAPYAANGGVDLNTESDILSSETQKY